MVETSKHDKDKNTMMKIEEVNFSLTTRIKSFRYFTETAIKEKLDALDGTIFRGPDNRYYLRTKIVKQPNVETIVIIFTIEDSSIEVITQTSDHYDWSEFQHLYNPPFEYQIE